MDSYPALARSARHQLRENPEMWAALEHWHAGGDDRLAHPNLLIQTGELHACDDDCPDECDRGGLLLPLLMLKGA